MEIVVLGAGSLGSLLGGLLATVHDVTLVGRRRHMEAVAADGLEITGQRSLRSHPRATTDVAGTAADLALVTVKSYDTHAAAGALAGADVDAVCSLQNGLGNEATLEAGLSCPVIGGTTTYGADLQGPGVVELTGEGDVTVGAYTDDAARATQRCLEAFAAAELPASVAPDIEATLWAKLAVNAAINPVTALARCRNGALTESPLLDVATGAATETARVGRELDVAIEPEAAVEAATEVAEATAANRSSMLQDVRAGRRTEIDAINGAVVDRADVTDVPVNATLAALVRGWEAQAGLRATDAPSRDDRPD